jgi:hypothetical protein
MMGILRMVMEFSAGRPGEGRDPDSLSSNVNNVVEQSARTYPPGVMGPGLRRDDWLSVHRAEMENT